MDVGSAVGIVVALIAALSAYASQRAASKASVTNTQTSTRVDMEKEAYDRARAFDTETIRRQDDELSDLRTENDRCAKQIKLLSEQNEELKRQVRHLVLKMARIERGLHPDQTHEGELQ